MRRANLGALRALLPILPLAGSSSLMCRCWSPGIDVARRFRHRIHAAAHRASTCPAEKSAAGRHTPRVEIDSGLTSRRTAAPNLTYPLGGADNVYRRPWGRHCRFVLPRNLVRSLASRNSQGFEPTRCRPSSATRSGLNSKCDLNRPFRRLAPCASPALSWVGAITRNHDRLGGISDH